MKYTLIAFQIINMGGEQQYCRNKIHEMKRRGYEVNLFSADKGNIYIDELKPFAENIYGELKYPIYCFTRSHVNRVIASIVARIGEITENSLIESVNIATSQWAEEIAKRLKCKHYCFALDEAYTVSNSEYQYLKYKYDRRELFGIAVQTLQLMFKGYLSLKDDESYFFDASCTNVIEDYEYTPEWLSNVINIDTICIGSIGRLEKGFVIPTLKQVREYTQRNNDKKFAIIMIGGTTEKNLEHKIRKIFEKSANTRVYITGFIYPIPTKLLKVLDVCISTAASTIITAVDTNIPTISVDTFTGAAIGIVDYTTTETMYAGNDIKTSLNNLLDDILVNDIIKNTSRLGMTGSKYDDTFSVETTNQLSFISQSNQLEYYDVFSLKPNSFKYRLYTFVGKTLGISALEYFHLHVLHRIKKLISRR